MNAFDVARSRHYSVANVADSYDNYRDSHEIRLEGDINNLSQQDQAMVDTHLRFMGSFMMFEAIRDKLIEEIHQKKSHKKRTVYHLNNTRDRPYYDLILFRGQKSISNMSGLHSSFCCEMEEVMFQQLANYNWSAAVMIYYSWESPLLADKKREYSSFSESDFLLSDEQLLNDDDIKVICRYRNNFTTFLSGIISWLAVHSNRSSKDMLKEINKTIKKINSV